MDDGNRCVRGGEWFSKITLCKIYDRPDFKFPLLLYPLVTWQNLALLFILKSVVFFSLYFNGHTCHGSPMQPCQSLETALRPQLGRREWYSHLACSRAQTTQSNGILKNYKNSSLDLGWHQSVAAWDLAVAAALAAACDLVAVGQEVMLMVVLLVDLAVAADASGSSLNSMRSSCGTWPGGITGCCWVDARD
ncbi:hypothetical protein SELMODRAFT_404708 [Selaginella moellendorffii]|uniref:Uncharacterized protein n=1 Tax=Selaginella moellendorffii TaxID=88036 RepID=D8QW57_SELML|nr:hypothetical protein SELMODRAFT_404708 [Selaginella moellendorffii]